MESRVRMGAGGRWEDIAVIRVREMLLISGSGEIIDLFIQQAVVEHLCASVLWP